MTNAAAPNAEELCAFCSEASGDRYGNVFYDILEADLARHAALSKTSNFAVVPSVGALVPGHVLIVPLHHVRSFGDIPRAHTGELDTLLTRTEAQLTHVFGKRCCIFEHGMSKDSAAGGCCDHAHWHVMPVDTVPLTEAQFLRDFRPKALASPLRLIGAPIDAPYLMLRSPTGPTLMAPAPRVASQYFRRLLASEIGTPHEWDWALFPNVDNIRITILTALRGPTPSGVPAP